MGSKWKMLSLGCSVKDEMHLAELHHLNFLVKDSYT